MKILDNSHECRQLEKMISNHLHIKENTQEWNHIERILNTNFRLMLENFHASFSDKVDPLILDALILNQLTQRLLNITEEPVPPPYNTTDDQYKTVRKWIIHMLRYCLSEISDGSCLKPVNPTGGESDS